MTKKRVMKLSGGERGGHCVNATTLSLCVHPLRARQISRTDQSASLGGAVTGPATFHHNVKNTDASKLSSNSFCFFTHSIPEHDVHTKLPTVMSVYVTPGWLHSKQCLFTPDWASSRTLRAQTSWLSRCFRFDILPPPSPLARCR